MNHESQEAHTWSSLESELLCKDPEGEEANGVETVPLGRGKHLPDRVGRAPSCASLGLHCVPTLKSALLFEKNASSQEKRTELLQAAKLTK